MVKLNSMFDRLKNTGTKLRKFILLLLFSFLFITGTAVFLLSQESIQNYFAHRFVSNLEKELNTNINLGHVSIDFRGNIHIEKLRILDLYHDTLLEFAQLDARIYGIGFRKHVITLSDVRLDNFKVKLGVHAIGSGSNLDFLTDYFDGENQNSHNKPWQVCIQKASLIGGDFVYFNKQKDAIDGLFDPNYLHFSGLGIDFDSMGFGKPIFYAKVHHIQGVERSGLTISKGRFNMLLDEKELIFSEMELKTPYSTIANRVELKYNSVDNLSDIFDSVRWNISLNKSLISLGDLQAFNPWFKNHTLPLHVDLNAVGTLSNLRLTHFSVATDPQKTLLKGVGRISSLESPSAMRYELNFSESQLAMDDIVGLVKDLDSIPQLKNFPLNTIQGKLSGSLNGLKFDGLMDANPGEYLGNFVLQFKNDGTISNFGASGSLSTFDLSRIRGDRLDVTINQASLTLNGTGSTPNDLQANLDLDIQQISGIGRSIKDCKIRILARQDTLDLDAIVSDPKFSMEANARILSWHSKPRIQATLMASNLVFDKLGLESLPLALSCNAVFDFGSEDLGNTNANFSVQQLVADHGATRYFCNNQQLHITENKGWTFAGDWINGNISSAWNIAEAQNLGQYLVSSFLPNRFKSPKNFLLEDMDFDLHINQTGWLSSVVEPTLETGPINLSGKIVSKNSVVQAIIGPVDFEFRGSKFAGATMDFHSNDTGTLRFNLESQSAEFGEVKHDTFAINGELEKGVLNVGINIHEFKDQYGVKLGFKSFVEKDSFPTDILNADIHIHNEPWQLDKRTHLSFERGNRIKVSNFMLNSPLNVIDMHGIVSASLRDTFSVEMENITPQILEPFFAKGIFDSLDFHWGGKLNIAGVLGDVKMMGTSYLNNVRYLGYDYGSFNLNLQEKGYAGVIGINFKGRKGPLKNVAIVGDLDLTDKVSKIDANLDIPLKTPLNILQPFLRGIVVTESGFIDGRVRFVGALNNPIVQGNVQVRDVSLGVDYLKTKYNFNGDFQVRSNGLFTSKPMLVSSADNLGTAKASLSIKHTNFTNFALDLSIYDANNLQLIKTKEVDNSVFYGTAWGNGSCRISGPFDKISIKMDMAPCNNSRLGILYPTLSNNSVAGNIKFRNHFGILTTKTEKKSYASGLGDIEILIRANPELETEFLIDKRLGDVIRGKGNGDIRILYDEKENFYLNGQYVIKSGEYVFSLPGINLLTKKIALDEGGKITWSGDPFDANLALSGRVEKRISPKQLMPSSSTNKGETFPATLIVSSLNISGSLLKPQITFDLQAPELSAGGAGMNSEVNSVIQRIRQDKDETLRQSISLLILGNFLPPSFSSGNPTNVSVIRGAGVAGNSVSTIASTVMNDIFSKYAIPTRIQMNIDDVQQKNGSTNPQLFVNSEWELSERLRLDLNYDPTVAMLVNSVAVPLNFNLEYNTRNENWRLKMFSRSSNMLSQANGNNVASGNTLGGSAVYRREFETFRRKKPPVKEIIGE